MASGGQKRDHGFKPNTPLGVVGSLDRFCTNCQARLKNQASLGGRKEYCPLCHQAIECATNTWGEFGLGRCINCYNFMLRTHCYCDHCSFPNGTGIGLKRKRQQDAHRQETEAKIRKIVSLEEKVKQLEDKLKEKEEDELLGDMDMGDVGCKGNGDNKRDEPDAGADGGAVAV